jgi:hypothetical protein
MTWDQFGDAAATIPVTLCLRHAGSGTQATLDAAVMSSNGGTIVKKEVLPGSFDVMFGIQPVTYFNDGSSDMMHCVGGAGTSGDYGTYTGIGAVGYADADKIAVSESSPVYHGDYGDIKLMSYGGAYPTDTTVINGVYNFWSAQWLYYNATDPMVSEIEDLIAFASDPVNLNIVGKGDFWAAQGEMKVQKATDDSWPIRID